MFRSIWSKTLRDYRIPLLCWGGGAGLTLLVVFATYGAQTSSASAVYASVGQTLRFLADPIALDTANGYATWRSMGLFIPLLLCIWALLAGTATLRGEEERSSMDLLLATPQSRARIVSEKILALGVALILAGLIITLGGIAGQASAKITVDAGRALLAGLNVSLIAFFFAGLALLISQLTSSRGAAAGWTGLLLVVAFLLDATGRTIDNGEWLRRFSPVYYYGLNKPLIPGYASNVAAALLLLGLSILFVVISVFLFLRRDIGRSALPGWVSSRAHARPVDRGRLLEHARRDIFNQAVSLRAIRAQAVSAGWWLLSIVAFAVWLTLLTPSLLEPLRKIMAGNPVFANLYSGKDITTNAGFLSGVVFQYTSIAIVVFALVQAVKWSSNLDGGRMELVLSTSQSRQRILLESFIATCFYTVLAALLLWLAVLLSANSINLSVDANKLAAASFGLLPLELIVTAAVYALAERVRNGAIIGIVSAYLVLTFLAEILQSLLKLPDWLISLSIFHDYGSPAVDGWRWGPSGAMLGIAALLLIIGVIQFRRSDIERGS